MAYARALTVFVVLLFLSLVHSAMGEPAASPEQLIQDLAASAKDQNADRFLSYLTTESRKAVEEWLDNQAKLRHAQEDFEKALDERFPEGRPKAAAVRDFKLVLSLISSFEFVSKKEGPDGTMELRVKTSAQMPDGPTICHEDSFLARKENGGWKLKIDPGPSDRILALKAALERVTASVRNQEIHDRSAALSELARVQFQEATHKPEVGGAFAATNLPPGGLKPLASLPPSSSNTVLSVHSSQKVRP